MSLFDLQFQSKLWLYSTLPVAILMVYVFLLGSRYRKQGLTSILNPRLRELFTRQVSFGKRRLKRGLILVSITLLLLAIARPQLGYFWEESPQETTDVLLALDTSKSMLAPDLKPNRLSRAKLEIEDFVKNLKGVRLGLIPFAGDAFLWCPLTYDTDAFLDTLKGVDTDIIPTGGTNLLSAIETAELSFKDNQTGTKIMILITDGENLQGQIDQKLPEFVRKGWVVHTIGIGTEEGELIPIKKPDGSTTFVTDKEGNVVKSKLDSDTLRNIAEQTGGTYHALGSTGQGLYDLFENVIRQQLESREESRLRKIPIERYGWVVAAIILLLVIELLMRDRKSKSKTASTLSTIALLFLLTVSNPNELQASPARDAQKAFTLGEYEQAEKLYQDAVVTQPDHFEHQYNLGVSALMNGNYPVAKQALDGTLNTTDLELQQPAYYNRGITNYHLGRQQLDSNPQETIEYWEQSIKDYENALVLSPDDSDAALNKAEVERLLEELKKLLENQDQNQDGDGEDNKEQNQDKDKENNQDQNSQDQQNQDQQDRDQQGNEDQSQNQSQDQSDQQEQEKNDSKDSSEQQQGQSKEEESQPEEQKEQQGQQEQEKDDTQEKENPEQQPKEPGEQSQTQPQQGQEGQAGVDPEKEAEQMEALRLLESLKNEDGDGKELLFHLQNPEPEADNTEQNW